jgi:hypothetical protein
MRKGVKPGETPNNLQYLPLHGVDHLTMRSLVTIRLCQGWYA